MTEPAGPPAAAPDAQGPPAAGPAPVEDGKQPVPGAADDGQAGGSPATAPEEPESHVVGPGQEASDATSRSGQGSARHAFLREADRLFVGGDVVGGGIKNVINLPGARRPRPRPVPGEQVALIRSAFAEPAGFDAVRRSFERARQTVILRGPEGCGKLGAAIRLLLDARAKHIFRLDDATQMRQLAEAVETDQQGRDRIETDAAFILNQPADFASLHSGILHSLEEALGKAGARLVITVNPGVLGPDHELLDYIVDLPSGPQADGVVASHLRYLLGDARAELFLTRPEIIALITEYAPDGLSCRGAADLAEAIAAEAAMLPDAGKLDIGKIGAQMAQRGSEDFEIWFAGLGDTRSATFAIALAVLNGLPYEVIVRAAAMLYQNFDNPPGMILTSPDQLPAEGPRPFLVSRRQLLYRLRAQTRESDIDGPYGTSTAEAAEYKDVGYSLSVILHAWSQYQVQDVLLGWLADLAEDPLEIVRIFAGRALGVLATRSFDYVTGRVLVPWARSTKPRRREAVAYALRFVAANSGLQPNVRRLVSGWYADRGSPPAQATAARAWGLALGALEPFAAVEALERLSAVDDIRVTIAIGDSIVDLLGEASDDLAGPQTDDLARFALARLVETLGLPGREAMAQLVFLILADGLDTRVSASAGGTVTLWPFLLRLSDRVPETRPALVQLWRHVLNDARFPDQAQQVITRWASAAESEPAMRTAFLRLARAIVRGDERTQMIVGRIAAKLTSEGNLRPLPLAGAGLQAVLDAERKPR